MKDNIPGYPGYHVTKDGKVYSRHTNRKGILSNTWTPLKTSLMSTGYLKVRICSKLGIIKNLSVHRLVAMVYIPNPNNYPLVMHLDDDKANNKVENLQWGTVSMNTLDAYNKGLLGKGEDHPNAKLSNRQKRRLHRLYYTGKYSHRELAKRFKVVQSTISKALKRSSKSK